MVKLSTILRPAMLGGAAALALGFGLQPGVEANAANGKRICVSWRHFQEERWRIDEAGIKSVLGTAGYAYVSAYCAAKHAVVGLVRALAIEAAEAGVTVNAVCPGYTDTDMTRDSLRRIADKTGRSHEEALAALLQNVPLGRLIRPEEVAAAVFYLCSAEAAAVNGATLAVAGGEI